MQPTEGGWSGGESMRGWGGMWIEWTRVWDSCCCYDVPLDSSWLVSLTEEVSASFIISWREKKTNSCKYIFHYCMIKYSQLHIFLSVQHYFFLPYSVHSFAWVKKFIKLLMLQRLVLQISKKYCNLRKCKMRDQR